MECLGFHVEDDQGADQDVFQGHHDDSIEGVSLVVESPDDQVGALGVAYDPQKTEGPEYAEDSVEVESIYIEESRQNGNQVDDSHSLKGIAKEGSGAGFIEFDIGCNPAKYIVYDKNDGRDKVNLRQVGVVVLDHDGQDADKDDDRHEHIVRGHIAGVLAGFYE